MLLPAGVGNAGTLCTPWLSVARQVGSKAGGLWGFFGGGQRAATHRCTEGGSARRPLALKAFWAEAV